MSNLTTVTFYTCQFQPKLTGDIYIKGNELHHYLQPKFNGKNNTIRAVVNMDELR